MLLLLFYVIANSLNNHKSGPHSVSTEGERGLNNATISPKNEKFPEDDKPDDCDRYNGPDIRWSERRSWLDPTCDSDTDGVGDR